ncbi:MAG: hypothetical protein HY040_06875 [Planctomycetes bacterium]|nr:hypothetical protein [Planctomycetota bacterium]
MKRGKFASLKWVKPKVPKIIPSDLAMLAATPTGRALQEAAATFGFPRAGKVTRSAQEQAIELLEAAAEVEQALLTQYLYAAYSIDPTGPAAVLRPIVVQIAKEEMGHLITVQNLLLALGANPYFDRENVPLGGKPAGQYPFPLKFEPFAGDSLAKYVTTESMPLDSINDPDLKKKLKPIFDRAAKAAGTVQHVGLLYAKLFWLFQPNDSPHPYWLDLPVTMLPSDWHIPDKALKKGIKDKRQVKPEEFALSPPATPSNPDGDPVYVFEITSRDQALLALAQIARQGEGYLSGFDSHFARFLKAYDDFASTFPAGVRPVPLNPNTAPKKQTKPEAEASRITHPKAVRWARLFDIRYQLLLLELWLGVWTERTVDGPLGRTGLFEASLTEMLARIRKIGGQFLPTMDLKEEDNNDRKTGAPFGLPDDPLPATEKTVKARMKQLLADAEGLAVEIENLPAPNAPTSAERAALTGMRSADTLLRDALNSA